MLQGSQRCGVAKEAWRTVGARSITTVHDTRWVVEDRSTGTGRPPSITPGLHYTLDTPGVGGLLVTRSEVFRVPGGARVEVRCSCGLHQARTAGGRASSVTMTAFVGHSIRFGAVVRIWASKRATGHSDYRYEAMGG